MVAYTCAECGVRFERRKGYSGPGRYCSKRCARTGAGRACRGDHHPNWKGGIAERPHSVRSATRRRVRDVGKCERCGSKTNLQGHHKIRYSVNRDKGDDPANIEVLCDGCHAAEHPALSGMIRRPRTKSGSMRPCLTCGVVFYVPPFKFCTARYCSRSCTWAGHSERRGIGQENVHG